MPRDPRASDVQQARDARWEAARAEAERIARAEVERMESQLGRLDPVTQPGRVREVWRKVPPLDSTMPEPVE